jgi:Flp pilus assembly protein TadB
VGTGEWITLAAVLVALAIGVASILHTQRLQKKERRERLLNEIIEWAIDILNCGLSKGFEAWRQSAVRHLDKANTTKEDILREIGLLTFSGIEESRSDFIGMRGKSLSIIRTSKIWGQDLQNATVKLANALEVRIKLLNKASKRLHESIERLDQLEIIMEEISEELGSQRDTVNSLAYKVIEKTSALKTKDIS